MVNHNTVLGKIVDCTDVRPFQDFFLEVRPFLRSNIITITVKGLRCSICSVARKIERGGRREAGEGRGEAAGLG